MHEALKNQKMENKRKNTKDLYLTAALRLFAEKGYDGVGVAEIAAAVGCTTSALYKHYAGKQALFDAMVEKSQRIVHEKMDALQLNLAQGEVQRQNKCFTVEEQVAMVHQLFSLVVDDEYAVMFRKLMRVEQFKHPEFAAMLNRQYVFEPISIFEQMMRQWISEGVIRDGDPKLMAVQYVSPITLMIDVCDREPERKQEILLLLADHIRHFNAVYRIK